MAFIIKDRVKENTTFTGTGAITLGGAAATFDSFQSYMTNGDTTYYAIVHTSSGVDEWEVGLGTWNTDNTLTRTTVLSGSNGTSAENFSAGSKDVFMTYPADKSMHLDANGNVDINGGTIDGVTIGATTAAAGNFTSGGFTGDVDIDGNIHVGEYIDFDAQPAHPAHREGRFWYDNVHKTLNYHSDDSNVIHELGLEEHMRVFNNSGAAITRGKPVYFTGAYTAGDNDVPTIGLANSTNMVKFKSMGCVASDIANNSYGYIVVTGILTGIDTSHLTVGENFFVGITDGATQTMPPVYPNFPMCLGFVVQADATDGIVLLAQQNHSIKTFRVISDTHIGGDLTIDGNLNVTGTTSTTSTSDVTAGAPFYRANEGDSIGESGTTFTGTGLDDAFFSGHFTGTEPVTYYVKIDGVGTGPGGVDTFLVSRDNYATTFSSNNAITGNKQLIHSGDNIYVEFGTTTGHTSNDQWTGTASPNLVDTGFWSNRNTGTSGVGYTHMGLWYDVSDSKWNLTDEYDSVPSGTIDKTDSTYVKGTLISNLEGTVTGNVTGSVTGNASSATTLATSRTIGGVSFDGSADITLPGVNAAGNQNTTGNASTATTLATARNIQLTGDVTGTASFDGSANTVITAVVQDDSHNHTIANVDNLQTSLNSKAPTARTLTAGNGLTGGGNLTANRTFAVGAGSGITVNADTVAHSDTSTQASSNNSGRTYIQDVTLDTFGHVTGLATATETVIDTTYSAGSGLNLSGTVFSHTDTSSQASVNNSNGTVIQDITLDTFGHITGIASTNLDGRYYTETEADSRFVNVTGDTMTGNLDLGTNNLVVDQDKGIVNSGAWTRITTPSGYINFGPANTTWAHIYTDRPNFYFNKDLYVNNQRVFHTGYHPNADKWTTARTLSLTGDVTGSVSWDGSGNASLGVTVASDVHQFRGDVTSADWNTLIDGTETGYYTAVNASGSNKAPSYAYGTIVNWAKAGQAKLQLYGPHNGSEGGNGLWFRTGWNTDYDPWAEIWHTNNDGSGSGLDADLLDGVQGSSYLRSDADDTFTGNLTLSKDGQDVLNFSANDTNDSRGISFNNRTALSADYNDGYLRLNQLSEFTNGIYTPGVLRVDGNLEVATNIVHQGDSDTYLQFEANTFNVYVGGSREITVNTSGVRLGDTGNGYFQPVSGNYGSIQIDAGAHSGYEGYSIGGRAVFMHDNGNTTGIYNDVNNEWLFRGVHNGASHMYHNGVSNLETVSSGIRVGSGNSSDIYMRDNDEGERRIHCNSNKIGFLNSSNGWGSYCDDSGNWYSDQSVRSPNFYVDSAIYHNGDTNTYMQFHAADQWRVVTGGAERLEVNSTAVLASVQIRSTSNVTAYYSDMRLKTKVADLDNALDKVNSLEGFYYVENEVAREHGYTNEDKQVALSAQAVQAVMPEAIHPAPFDVGIDDEGNEYSKSGENYLTVDYARLVPLLVEAIKELKQELDELKG